MMRPRLRCDAQAHAYAAAPARRRGTVIPLLAVTMVVVVGFLALSIDVGMLAIARTQVQQAADLSALTAARTVNGDPTIGYNESNATTNAQRVIAYNQVLGKTLTASQLQLSFGSYDYNQTTQTFGANFPATTGMPCTAVAATVTASNLPMAFAPVLGSKIFPTLTATAQAVHRPRDIALVMDLSGSMRFGTCTGFDFYTSTRSSNNPDTLRPTFGHYSSGSAVMQGPSTNQSSAYQGYTISPSNVTASSSSYSLTYVNNFYQGTPYSSPLVRAFDSASSSDGGATWGAAASGASPTLPASTYASTPGGDAPLFKQSSTTAYATNTKDVLNTTTRNAAWELDGYSNYTSGTLSSAASGQTGYANAPFRGYIQGPGYYGKTFFTWPPDPRHHLTSASTAMFGQFITDFGYTTADTGNTAAATTLSASITSSQTSITVTSASSFPTAAVPFLVQVNNAEVMKVTAVSGTTWTVTRAVSGSTAAAATSGQAVALATKQGLNGIYSATTGVASSQNWPWPNDGGTTLSAYLLANVYIPGGSRKLQTTDAQYQKFMRLYNWDYVVDSVGTTSCDWRLRFFGTNDNTKLFNSSSGKLNAPSSSTYTINYNEILRWIAQSPCPFPSQLWAGRIRYYSAIPTAITGTWPSYGSTDQRFWVEYIDYALGFRQTAAGSYTDVSAMAGYGADFAWGTAAVTSPPGSGTQSMTYTDSPYRPLLRFWFGPLTMVDYLNNYNMMENVSNYFFMQPGDAYEAPMYTAKEAYVAAVKTMEENHPNDWVTVVPYSQPRSSATDTAGRLNCVRSPLGTNYAYAGSALLFPFSTINSDGTANNTVVTPYAADPSTSQVPSSDFRDIPRGDGETCFAMALMLAYNQFAVTPASDGTLRNFVTSTPIAFPAGMAGGQGRKGAQKVVIFETDGLPNTTATATLVSTGTYKYYKIRYNMNSPSASEYPTVSVSTINASAVTSQINSLVQQLAADYGTSRNPFRLYAIGFGPVFQGSNASAALSTLENMQYYAGMQSSPGAPLPTNQVITGADTTMSTAMINTFTSILENGVQIALIK